MSTEDTAQSPFNQFDLNVATPIADAYFALSVGVLIFGGGIVFAKEKKHES